MNILIVEDEKNIADIIAFNLRQAGFKIKITPDGEAGLKIALNDEPDLILLDVMLPKMDGFEVCKRIREVSQVPIIMLTARVEDVDKFLGFELGADDYITKPYNMQELIYRVRANLKRVRNPDAPATPTQEPIVIKDVVINPDLYEVRRDGELIALTRKEYDLAVYLATHKERVVPREELLEKVWGYEYLGDVRTVDVTIRRLRTKLEPDPDNHEYIIAKRGVGYYFASEC